MQTKKYKEWRENVYKRDNYTCLKCGQKGYKLNVHHILSYSEYKNLRTNIDNGITLCENCHKKFHKLFGFYDFDKNDMNTFLKGDD